MMRLDNDAVAVSKSVWYLPESTPYQIDARMEIIGTEGVLYINCGEAGLEIQDARGGQMPIPCTAESVRRAIWHPPRRIAIFRRLRARGPRAGADHARRVARSGPRDGRRRKRRREAER